MVSKIVHCSCGTLISRRKMRSVNGELLCPNCASIADTYNKRMARRADEYQVIVSLLDGTRQYYHPIGEQV